MPDARLIGPDAMPITKPDGGLLPHYVGFASIVQSVSRTYSYRYDEAKRDSRINALAMRRDAYLKSLLQERKKPTAKLKWEIEVDDDKDPVQKVVKDGVTASLKATWRWRRMLSNLLEALWYGRYGVQVQWSRDQQGRWHISRHRPVNGDKIMYGWDGVPAVLLHTGSLDQATYRDSIISTDAGGRALKLEKPEWRRQFVIHQHEVDDADFMEGEMAGGVHGVGLRSWAYWSYWIRQELFDWMISFMESVGMMDLLIFNYDQGNPAAKANAEAMAKRITGKVAIAMPRNAATEKYDAVETIPMNTAGLVALKDLIESFCERHLERLFVGQTLSAGTEGSGLGGTGVAGMHMDTKFHLIEDDADNLSETITEDIVGPLVGWQYAYADFPVRFRMAVVDPESAEKLKSGIELAKAGARVKEEDLLDLAGFVAAGPNDATLTGGQPLSLVDQVLAQQSGVKDPGDDKTPDKTDEGP